MASKSKKPKLSSIQQANAKRFATLFVLPEDPQHAKSAAHYVKLVPDIPKDKKFSYKIGDLGVNIDITKPLINGTQANVKSVATLEKMIKSCDTLHDYYVTRCESLAFHIGSTSTALRNWGGRRAEYNRMLSGQNWYSGGARSHTRQKMRQCDHGVERMKKLSVELTKLYDTSKETSVSIYNFLGLIYRQIQSNNVALLVHNHQEAMKKFASDSLAQQKKMRDQHAKEIKAMQVKYEKHIQTLLAAHAADLKKQREKYEAVISDLKDALAEYDETNKQALSLLAEYSRKLHGASTTSATKALTLKAELAKQRSSTADAKLVDVRNDKTSVGVIHQKFLETKDKSKTSSVSTTPATSSKGKLAIVGAAATASLAGLALLFSSNSNTKEV